MFVQIYNGATLGGQRYPGHLSRQCIGVFPEQLARFTEVFPKVLRMLFRPARLLGEVGFNLLFALANEIALSVEQQGPHALGAVVDSQDERFGRVHPVASCLAGNVAGSE